MKHCLRGLATAAALSLTVPMSLRGDMTFSDIHYWTGEGTNSAALVIDWTDEARPESALVWGFRWNGDTGPTVAEMLAEVARDDRRFHVFTSLGTWGLQINAIGYDADGDGGQFHYKKLRGDDILAEASDADDYMDGGWMFTGYWEFLYSSIAKQSFENGGVSSSWWGADFVAVEPGNWYVMRFAMLSWWNEDWSEFNAPPARTPNAAETPYAWVVVEALIETDPRYNPTYNNPEVVLGRPALSTVANGNGAGGQGRDPLVPVTPVLPAILKKDIVSLSNPADEFDNEVTAYLSVQFDHPVVDDPLNPYGLDFIVFGNAFQSYSSENYLTGTENPNTVTLLSAMTSEPGWVEVSQDGTTWHRYTSGRFADDFAPTLSRVYDTNNPVLNLFGNAATNYWWGAPSDPTLPLDPAITASGLAGKTLAEVAVYYNGSAGGNGFDIGQSPLATDAHGRKWIQYVRIVSQSDWSQNDWSEIDAFADVAPSLPYDHWARQHFSWTQLPDTNTVGMTAVASNDWPNFYNAALGIAPDDRTAPGPDPLSFRVNGATATATFPCAQHAEDIRFFLQRTLSLENPVWTDVVESRGPTVSDGNGGFIGQITIPVNEAHDAAFYRFGVGTYK